jgi:hypothetical protein
MGDISKGVANTLLPAKKYLQNIIFSAADISYKDDVTIILLLAVSFTDVKLT